MRIIALHDDASVRDDEIVGVERSGTNVIVMLRGREWPIVKDCETDENARQFYRAVVARWRGLGAQQ
mgnify:FL=1